MSIDLGDREGKKIVFNRPDSGLPSHQALAGKYLVPGGVYTIDRLEVDRNTSKVMLEEIPDVWFNPVMFDDCDEVYGGRFGKLRKLTHDKLRREDNYSKNVLGSTAVGWDGDVWIIGSKGAEKIHDLIGESVVELKLLTVIAKPLGFLTKLETVIKRLEKARELVYQYYEVEEEPGR